MSRHNHRRSPSGKPLSPGTGVVLYRPDLRGHRADISSYSPSDESYSVTLRGASVADSVCGLRREEVGAIDKTGDTEDPGNETHRRLILELAGRRGGAAHLSDLAAAIGSCDACCHALAEDLAQFPPSAEVVLVAMVHRIKEYYQCRSWSLPISSALLAHVSVGLKLWFDDESADGAPSCRITSFGRQLDASLESAEFDPRLVFAAVAYALFSGEVVEQEDGSGHLPVEAYAAQIDALWCVVDLLTDHPRAPFVRRSVDDALVGSPGAAGFTSRHLLWIACCRYITLCKDLRVHFPAHAPSRHPDRIDRLVRCAETAVSARPDCPHSYFLGSYLLMDTIDVGRASARVSRYDTACRWALRGLEAAEDAGNPFYKFHCHVLVAYWKLTSAYKRPYTLKEVLGHVRSAERAGDKCAAYTTTYALHRGKTIRKYVKQMVAAWLDNNDTYDVDDVFTTPITLGNHDEAGVTFSAGHGYLGSGPAPGMERGGKFSTYNRRHECAVCNVTVAKLLKCARCQAVTYCGVECQKFHWKKGGHKAQCVPKKK
mmetsp:Transcript_42365/g.83227  ORF Transcript_42365/g.83227 Transcript_42365/m.83227 type:complete len:543 (-) Transcript_42365:124-1752(-)